MRSLGRSVWLWLLLCLLAISQPVRASERLYAIDVPQLGRLALPGTSPRQAITRYLNQLISAQVFPGSSKALRAWGERVAAKNELAPTVQTLAQQSGRPVTGIELNEVADLIGDRTHLANRKLYARGLERAQNLAIFLPPAITREDAPQYLDVISHLLLVGGDDTHPALNGQAITHAHRNELNLLRDKRESHLVKAAIARQMPIDSVCRGMQLLNRIAGGTMYQDLYEEGATTVRHSAPGFQPTALPVEITPGTSYARDLGKVSLRSARFMHHQAVAEAGAGVTIAARTPDGIVAAIESHGGLVRGTQFHPERALRTKYSRMLFAAMGSRARAYQARSR